MPEKATEKTETSENEVSAKNAVYVKVVNSFDYNGALFEQGKTYRITKNEPAGFIEHWFDNNKNGVRVDVEDVGEDFEEDPRETLKNKNRDEEKAALLEKLDAPGAAPEVVKSATAATNVTTQADVFPPPKTEPVPAAKEKEEAKGAKASAHKEDADKLLPKT